MKIEGAGGNFKPTPLNPHVSREKQQVSAGEKEKAVTATPVKSLPSDLQARYAQIFERLQKLQTDYNTNAVDSTRIEIDRLLTEMDNLIGGALQLNQEFIEQVGAKIQQSGAVLNQNAPEIEA